jgi:hypothetical protein
VIEFTTILLKPASDPKSDGCGCNFSPAGVAVDRFGRVSRVWLQTDFCQTRPVAIPDGLGNLAMSHYLHLTLTGGGAGMAKYGEPFWGNVVPMFSIV